MQPDRYEEDPRQVLLGAIEQMADGPVALAIVAQTLGGAVRAPGAILAVGPSGFQSGYVSGGCIDEDVANQARESLRTGRAKVLRYGAGSPFIDLPLPCGGAIDCIVAPIEVPDDSEPLKALLRSRKPVRFAQIAGLLGIELPEAMDLGSVVYDPAIRLRIAGRGADSLALARLGRLSNFDVMLQLVDEADCRIAEAEGLPVQRLTSPGSLPPSDDDPFTAFLLAFHDVDWEVALLQQAVSGPAFYLGAIGSRATQERRRNSLKDAGMREPDLARIIGPVGLVPSQRDASKLAVSTMAEILTISESVSSGIARRTAVILLAAGSGTRFADGDKLLAELDGSQVLEHSASLRHVAPFAKGIAIVRPGDRERRLVLEREGWSVVENEEAALGRSTSLRAALDQIEGEHSIDGVLVLLADMPNVTREHLLALLSKAGQAAVMSKLNGIAMPPAYIPRPAFESIRQLAGDEGFRSLIKNNAALIELTETAGIDIDTREDLALARKPA